MPLEQLAARLDDRFRLLTGGSRAALPRHRTLRAVVDWSWGLLEEHERALARELAVFSAGATEESAAAVAGDPRRARRPRLAGRQVAAAGRRRPGYRMLETIREYGAREARRGGRGRGHAHRARALLRGVRRGAPSRSCARAEQQRPTARLQAEHDDVIAALRWLGDSGDRRGALRLAVALLWFWMLSGAQDEAHDWIDFAFTVPGEADPVDVLIAEGILTMINASRDRDAAEQLKRDRRAPGARRRRAPAARARPPDPRPVRGRGRHRQVRLAETLEHPDPWTRAAATLIRAHLAENTGDQEHMRADLERAVEGFREIGDSWALGMTLSSLASTLMLADDLDGAETVLDEATELLDTLQGSAPAARAAVAAPRRGQRPRRGDLDAAREHVQRVIDDTDMRREENVIVRATLARIERLAGNLERMREIVTDLERRVGDPPAGAARQEHARAFVHALIAQLAIEDGDLERAARVIDGAIELAVATTDMPIVAIVGSVSVALSLRAGRVEDAAEQLGACAVLRGAEDRSNPELSPLLERSPDTRRPTSGAAA